MLLRALDAIEDGGSLSAKQARFLLQRQLRQTEERIIELILRPEQHWVPRGGLTLPIWKTLTFHPVPISESVRTLKSEGALCPELEQLLSTNGWLEDQCTSINTPTPIQLVRFNARQVFKTMLGNNSSYGALGTLLDDDALERLSWSQLSTGSIHTLPVDLALQLRSQVEFDSDEPVVIATPNIGSTPLWKVLRRSRFGSSGMEHECPCLGVGKSLEAEGIECCNAEVIFQYVPEPDMTLAGAE